MAKKAFNLGDYLQQAGGVQSGHAAEQIVLIDLDRIDPDPANFYSLDGIEELAANIETVGLLDALRVRPNGDRFTIVSGHRRRAALQLLRDSGCERWRDGVPCIIELGEASDAMRELRLIFANSSTRVMSPADLSKQAERVTQLLYELKEQGVEFPGRMRDHVAEACKVSQSKLARLHAIRSRLDPEMLAYFDTGMLPEETAYQLSRLPQEIQVAAARELSEGRRKAMPRSYAVEAVVANLEGLQTPMPCRAHAGGPACHNVTARIVRSIWAGGSWDICPANRCCMDCPSADRCSGACREAKAKAKLDADVQKEKQAQEEKRQEPLRDGRRRAVQARCRELLPLIEAAGLQDGDKLYDAYTAAKVSEVRAWAAGDYGEKVFWSDEPVRPTRVADLQSMARTLGVTAARLLGEETTNSVTPPKRSETMSESDTEAAWMQGTPPRDGRFLCMVDIGTSRLHEQKCEYRDGEWSCYGRPFDEIGTVEYWWPLPPEKLVTTKMGDWEEETEEA